MHNLLITCTLISTIYYNAFKQNNISQAYFSYALLTLSIIDVTAFFAIPAEKVKE